MPKRDSIASNSYKNGSISVKYRFFLLFSRFPPFFGFSPIKVTSSISVFEKHRFFPVYRKTASPYGRSPDWKVWKLRAGDFKNLIVNIQKASKLRAGDIRRAIQTFHTGETTVLYREISCCRESWQVFSEGQGKSFLISGGMFVSAL